MRGIKRCNLCNKLIVSDIYICVKCHNEKIAGKVGLNPKDILEHIKEFEENY